MITNADPATQLAGLLGELPDEVAGPLATVRGLVEYAARRLGSLPQAHAPDAGRALELVAIRLYDVQTDLGLIATRLVSVTAARARHTSACRLVDRRYAPRPLNQPMRKLCWLSPTAS